jgi:hypothetical protein
MMKKGDRVKLTKLVSNKAEDWLMSEREFEIVKKHVGKIGKVIHIQKHFEDTANVNYFIDVEYSSGFKLMRVNKIAFETVDFDFDYV